MHRRPVVALFSERARVPMGSGRQPARRKTAKRRKQELLYHRPEIQKSAGQTDRSSRSRLCRVDANTSKQLMASGTLGKIHLQLRHLRQLRQQRTQRKPDWLLRTTPSPPSSPPAVPGPFSVCPATWQKQRAKGAGQFQRGRHANGEEIRSTSSVGVDEKRRWKSRWLLPLFKSMAKP